MKLCNFIGNPVVGCTNTGLNPWATVGGFFSTLTLVVGTVPFTATSLGVPFHSFFYLFEMYI
jgi:hypothetical protein